MVEMVSAWLYYLALVLIPYGLLQLISAKRLFIIYASLITICLVVTLPYLYSAWELKDPVGIPYLYVLFNVYAYAALGILVKGAILHFKEMNICFRQAVVY